MLSFIEILKAILFGIVEGITEWLPVSSTGHMILLNEFVHMNVSEEFWDMFLVVIQLGAILAVVLLFWKQIWPFNFTGRSKTNGIVKKDIMKMWFKIIVACIPAAVVGLLFDDILEKYLYNPITVAVMLILFGIGFILVENGHKGKRARVRSLAQLTYKDAIIIGLFQLIAAIFPGTSRSGPIHSRATSPAARPGRPVWPFSFTSPALRPTKPTVSAMPCWTNGWRHASTSCPRPSAPSIYGRADGKRPRKPCSSPRPRKTASLR